jgi:hypothetical protein
VEIGNVTLDCNWSNQGSRTSDVSTNSFRNGGIYFYCYQGYFHDVNVINLGANGRYYNNDTNDFCHPATGDLQAGTECFPFVVTTISLSDTNSITIDHCEVDTFYSQHNAYCTAIMVGTRYGAGTNNNLNRTVGTGYSSGYAAVIDSCTVNNVWPGIGFGCSDSDKVLFIDNTVNTAGCGFNCDTGGCARIAISDNTFNLVNDGISYVAPTLSGSEITDNVITLTGALSNSCGTQDSFGVLLSSYAGAVTVSGNTVSRASSYAGPYYYKLESLAHLRPASDSGSVNTSAVQTDFLPINTQIP